MRRLLSASPWSWNWIYWALFGGILSLGIAYRAFWTRILLIPFINPDTMSYLAPILARPWVPFSEMRTGGAPFVFMLGASAASHPVGILLAHHALWLASTVGLAVAIRKYLGLKWLSLLVLGYLTFNAKAISFEYYAMSEHLSRVMYVFYAAAALATWRHPRSWRLAALIAALVAFNVFVKPSAIVLLPATVILYAFHAWRFRHDCLRPILSAGLVSVALLFGGLAAYATAFKARYGTFSISAFEGFNFFSHVGHLLDLEGSSYRELKAELAPVMKLYREKYVAQGVFEPNWLVYGSVNDRLRADFGSVSPAGIIKAYALRSTGRDDIVTINKIYFDLAIEGVLAHPRAYLDHAWLSFNNLFRRGYGFMYYRFLPSPETLEAHRSSTVALSRVLFSLAGATDPPNCERSRAITQSASWPLRVFMADQIFGCLPHAYDRPEVRHAIDTVHGWYVGVGQRIQQFLLALPFWAACFAVLLVWPRWHGTRARRVTCYAAFFALSALGYGMFLALFNVAELTRFMMNIQDFLMLAMGLVFAAVAISMRRALLHLTYARGFSPGRYGDRAATP